MTSGACITAILHIFSNHSYVSLKTCIYIVVQVLDDSLADTVSAPIPVIDLLQLFIAVNKLWSEDPLTRSKKF